MNFPFGSTASQSGLTNATTTQAAATTDDGMTWWFRWLIKIVSVVLGLLGFILGLIVAISFSAKCMVAGIILM